MPVPSKFVTVIIGIGIYIVLLLLLCVVLKKLIYIPYKAKKDYIESILGEDFKDYQSKKSRRVFVETQFQNIPPNRFPDPHQARINDASKPMIKHYLNTILQKGSTDSPLYCVLAGAGMGKTFFMVNLLTSYVHKYPAFKRPYEIVLINLAKPKSVEQIKDYDPINRRRTILLLDAMDENPDANNNYDEFISQLEESFQGFAFVVISCRTQFFANEENELKESKLIRSGRQKGFYSYSRHYIAPFSDDDVELYLRKKYVLAWRKKKKASNIIRNCSSLACRPLLLSYIDDLVESEKKGTLTMIDVYDTIVSKWFERETSRLDNSARLNELLDTFSQRLSVEMYEENGGIWIEDSKAKTIWDSICSTDEERAYNYKLKSLINRDTMGVWKFSHRSFLEYYLAKEYFSNESFNVDLEKMDLAYLFYTNLANKYYDDLVKQNAIQFDKSHTMKSEVDTIFIQNSRGVSLRHLSAKPEITVLDINARDFDSISQSLTETKINYVRIHNYTSFLCNLKILTENNSIKYVRIDGDTCSKSFVKAMIKVNKSLINNGPLLSGEYSRDMPIDFSIAASMYESDYDSSFEFFRRVYENE